MQASAFRLRHKLSLDDYHKMGEAGIFAANDRVELIAGDLIDMAPIGSKHAGSVNLLLRLLDRAIGNKAIVAAQNPVALAPDSEPEPDIALLKPRKDFYKNTHPTAEDVLLLIEVADTTLQYDRDIKIPLYGQHGIAEVWLIDLDQECLSIYLQPRQTGGYRQILLPESSETLTPTQLPEMQLQLTALWR